MNPQISPLETLYVNSKKISCDGGKDSSGHPLIYLNMGNNDFVVCPYCSKFFTTKQRSIPSPSHHRKSQNQKNEQ